MNEDQYYCVSGGCYKVLDNPTLKETEQSKIITFSIKGGGDRNDFAKHREYTVIITADRKDGETHNMTIGVNNTKIKLKENNIETFKEFYLQLLEALRNKKKKDCTKMLAMKIFCLLTNLDINTLKEQDTNMISQKSFIQKQQADQSPAPEPNFFTKLFTCYWCRNNNKNNNQEAEISNISSFDNGKKYNKDN